MCRSEAPEPLRIDRRSFMLCTIVRGREEGAAVDPKACGARLHDANPRKTASPDRIAESVAARPDGRPGGGGRGSATGWDG